MVCLSDPMAQSRASRGKVQQERIESARRCRHSDTIHLPDTRREGLIVWLPDAVAEMRMLQNTEKGAGLLGSLPLSSVNSSIKQL